MAGRFADDSGGLGGDRASPEAWAAAAEASAEAAAASSAEAEARATEAAASSLHPFSPAGSAGGAAFSSAPEPQWDELMSPAGSSPGAPPWLGRRIGRFRLLSLLGQGAMGRVFRADDTLLQRHVALKVLPARAASGDDRPMAVGRLIREARAAASLEHPHIVQVFEVNEAAGVFYIAMELAEGGSLKDLVTGSGALAPVTACQLAAEAAEALAHAHARRVVHRDVKPANLMLTRSGRCKVADFGLARVEDAGDRSALLGETVGTPRFVAPEVLRGGAATARSDVYSLGATLWYLLTARPPFAGETAAEVMRGVLHAPLPDLRRLRPETSDRLIQTVHRALARDPERRFESCDQFAKVLRVHTVPSVETQPGLVIGGSSRLGSASGSGGLGGLADLVAGSSPVPAATDEPAPARPRSKAFRRRAVLLGAALLTIGAVSVIAWRQSGRGSPQANGSAVPEPARPPATTPAAPFPLPGITTQPAATQIEVAQAATTQPAPTTVATSQSRPAPGPSSRAAEINLIPRMFSNRRSDTWLRGPIGAGSKAEQHSGKLVLTGTGHPFGRMFLASPPERDFDFFSAPLTLTATGLSFRGEGTKPVDQVLRIAVSSEQKYGQHARDIVGLWLAGDGTVKFGYQQGGGRGPEHEHPLIRDARVPGRITGVTMTLDALRYRIAVAHTDEGGQDGVTIYEGAYSKHGPGLDRRAWGVELPPPAAAGKAVISVAAQQMESKPANSVTIEIGSLVVSRPKPAAPPPAKAAAAGKGG